MSELTTKKGCFNCEQYAKCRKTTDEERGIDPMQIEHGKNNIPYRAGCCCESYVPKKANKEVVRFD